MEEMWTDNDLLSFAVTHWANWIETGDVTLSARDAAEQGKPFWALSTTQMKTVVRLRELAEITRHIKIVGKTG